MFARALSAPLYWIAANAGLDGAVAVNKVAELPAGHGLNAATLTYGDLVADGIVDPVKVTRSAVLNAASVARMVLTTETAIVEKPAEERGPRPRSRPRALIPDRHQPRTAPEPHGSGAVRRLHMPARHAGWAGAY